MFVSKLKSFGLLMAVVVAMSAPFFTSSANAAGMDCDMGMKMLKMQNSANPSVFSKAWDDAMAAKNKGDMEACGMAVGKAMSMTPMVHDKYMACAGGLAAMQTSASGAFAEALRPKISAAEEAMHKGDLEACMKAVDSGMALMPEKATSMHSCMDMHSKAASSSSSFTAQAKASFDSAESSIMAGDFDACNMSLKGAMK